MSVQHSAKLPGRLIVVAVRIENECVAAVEDGEHFVPDGATGGSDNWLNGGELSEPQLWQSPIRFLGDFHWLIADDCEAVNMVPQLGGKSFERRQLRRRGHLACRSTRTVITVSTL